MLFRDHEEMLTLRDYDTILVTRAISHTSDSAAAMKRHEFKFSFFYIRCMILPGEDNERKSVYLVGFN